MRIHVCVWGGPQLWDRAWNQIPEHCQAEDDTSIQGEVKQGDHCASHPNPAKMGQSWRGKKSKTKQNQEEEKKNTFLPLYFHFPQHFIYTHDAVLEKQKGRHREQQPSEVRARRVAG